MAVTRSGVAGGLLVANHAKVELSIVLVHAPIPRQHTEEEIAVDWDQIRKSEDVTYIDVQVTFSRKKCGQEKNNNATTCIPM